MLNAPLVLASASPRRLALLRSVGLRPDVRPAHVDETPARGEPPRDTVLRLAIAKAERIGGEVRSASPYVLAADTTVLLDGRALGKPESPEDAARMLNELSAREHEVVTGVCLIAPRGERRSTALESTAVAFRRLDDRWIRRYVASGEPMDKAGAYGIQERGVWLTRAIRGSWSNVVGLPLERLPELFDAVGVDPVELFSP